jgi:plastocyanin
LPKKKRSKQQRTSGEAPTQQGPALSSEEQAARREQQKREWAAQKRAQERARRSAAPMVWAGVAVGSLVAMIALGFLLFAGGGSGSSGPTPTATRDPRLGTGPVAKTVTVDADDQGQATNPTFSVTTITGNAGEIIEIDVNNIGSVAHNLNVAGLDGEYGSRDDWVTDPQSIAPGESGKVLVKFNDPGTYPFHCDFHPEQQKGNLIIN